MLKPIILASLVLLVLIVSAAPDLESSDYEYIYENLSKQVPIYEKQLIVVPAAWNTTSEKTEPAYSYNITVFKEHKTEYYQGKRIGVDVKGKKIIGIVNVQDNTVSKWSVPIGDRNFEEFGRCRPYEIEKGVCTEETIK